MKYKIIHSKLLHRFKNIKHGFTTKFAGNFQKRRPEGIVVPNQTHSDKMVWLTNKINYQADGLITNQKGIAIGVRTADCVPLLFYESESEIIAAVHAGWRGTLKRIAQKAVEKIAKAGGKTENIIAAIGPHIGLCCYNIDKQCADRFVEEFGSDRLLIRKIGKVYYLNLMYANYKQLLESGVKKQNIDYQLFCTKCQEDLFFSYRRSKSKTDYGEMVSFIKLV